MKNTKTTVPVHLQDAHYKGSEKLGRGIGYEYAHDFPKHFSRQRYLPEGLEKGAFYTPGARGWEAWRVEAAARDRSEQDEGGNAGADG